MFQFRPFPSYAYLIQRTILEYCSSGFPHSEIHGYNGYLLLPVAYRSLSRPSSAPDAKAFPLRSFQLDLSNHLLILKVELCRQFNRIFEIVIVTHLYDVPQLKLKIRSFKLYVQKTSLLPCLSLLHSTLFSFQGSLFQLLLQPDLKIRLLPGLQIQRQMSSALVGPSGLEPPTLRLSVVRSSQLSYGPLLSLSVPPRVRRTSVLHLQNLAAGQIHFARGFLFSRVPAKAYAFVGWWR